MRLSPILGLLLLASPLACRSLSSDSAFSPYDGQGASETFAGDGEIDDTRPVGLDQVSEGGTTILANHKKPWDFWIDPDSPAAKAEQSLRANQSADADLLRLLAMHPVASWYNSTDPEMLDRLKQQVAEAKAQNQYALIVIDYLPYRDCPNASLYSEYAAPHYRAWIKKVASALATGKALIIYEPAGITRMDCLAEAKREERLQLMNEAVTEFKKNRNLLVYIDVSDDQLLSVEKAVDYLKKAGIDKAMGFALNTGRYQTKDLAIRRGREIRKKLPEKNFVIDTSRNGKGPAEGEQRCNPRGRALGETPTSETNIAGLDAYLWIKRPGESDGECGRGDPAVGVFSPSLAIELVKNAGY